MNLRLATSRDSILNSAKVYEERNLSKVHSAFAQIVNRVENFSKQKQLNTIKEHQLAQSIFTEIREDNAANQKKAAIEARM